MLDTLKKAYCIFHICGNHDFQFHAMTKYVLELHREACKNGTESYFLSDIEINSDINGIKESTIISVDWKSINEKELVDIIFYHSLDRGRIPIIHLNLLSPNHGRVISSKLLNQFPTVITCHEHSSLEKNLQLEQLEYFEAADHLILSTNFEKEYIISQRKTVRSKVVLRHDTTTTDLVFGVPPNIVPPAPGNPNTKATGVVHLGMLRNGHDWQSLFEFVKRLESELPETEFHLIGSTVNPQVLEFVFEKIYGIKIGTQQYEKQPLNETPEMLFELANSVQRLNRQTTKRLKNIVLHLNKTDDEISAILMNKCFAAVQYREGGLDERSGAVAALIAHGIPVITNRGNNSMTQDNSSSSSLDEAVIYASTHASQPFWEAALIELKKIYSNRSIISHLRPKMKYHLARNGIANLYDGCLLSYDSIFYKSKKKESILKLGFKNRAKRGYRVPKQILGMLVIHILRESELDLNWTIRGYSAVKSKYRFANDLDLLYTPSNPFTEIEIANDVIEMMNLFKGKGLKVLSKSEHTRRLSTGIILNVAYGKEELNIDFIDACRVPALNRNKYHSINAIAEAEFIGDVLASVFSDEMNGLSCKHLIDAWVIMTKLNSEGKDVYDLIRSAFLTNLVLWLEDLNTIPSNYQVPEPSSISEYLNNIDSESILKFGVISSSNYEECYDCNQAFKRQLALAFDVSFKDDNYVLQLGQEIYRRSSELIANFLSLNSKEKSVLKSIERARSKLIMEKKFGKTVKRDFVYTCLFRTVCAAI